MKTNSQKFSSLPWKLCCKESTSQLFVANPSSSSSSSSSSSALQRNPARRTCNKNLRDRQSTPRLPSCTTPKIYQICGSQFEMYDLHRFVPQSHTFFLYNSTNLPHLWISVPNEQICIDLFHKVAPSSCIEQLHKSTISVDLNSKCTYGVDLFHNDKISSCATSQIYRLCRLDLISKCTKSIDL